MKNSLKITIPVTNTGSVAGAEVVQLYIADKEASVDRPVKELKGFEKVWLEPGETKNVEFTIDRSALSFYDESSKSWVAESGAFEALVGAASDDIRSTAEFNLR
jgi:beta-glucosidase